MRLTENGRARAAAWSRRIAIVLVLAINAGNLFLRFTTNLPQLVFVLLFLGSIIPYLIHLHWIEPRLMAAAREGGGTADHHSS